MDGEPAISKRMARNTQLYLWYSGLFHAHFWMPVFFLYFSAHFSLDRVLVLEAIYYGAVVILEVPSGYFSDTLGRRATLLISTAALVVGHSLFLLGDSFAVFCLGQFALAAGIAFNSGTDTAIHYESLAALGRTEEYDEREAIAARNGFWGSALAALGGGAVAAIDLRLAYLCALITAIIAWAVVAAMADPPRASSATPSLSGLLRQLWRCSGYLRNRALAWLFAFYMLMTVINHIPYEFYQPYLGLLDIEMGLPNNTPMATGFHAAATMIIAAWLAASSIRWRDRVGVGPALLSAALLQCLIIAAMGFALHWSVAVFALLRSSPRALMTAPLNAAIAPRVANSERATYLSLQSLAGRLAFSVTLVALSALVADSTAPTWDALQRMLWTGLAIGLTGAGILMVTRQALHNRGQAR